jgi:isopentenyl-diphosphate Delta-isomerase
MTLRRDAVILVNDHDEWIGTADKIAVHRSGALHRALSIFITNSKGEMLLQQRAPGKYHSAGLWSNACCSHPTPGEPTMTAAHRRLLEELGIETTLMPITTICYQADVGDMLREHEYDHIFTANWDGSIEPGADEVSAVCWVDEETLDNWMREEPAAFTAWFPILLNAWRKARIALRPLHA